MTTTTDRFARGSNLDAPVQRESCTTDQTCALDSVTHEVTSTHSTVAATHPTSTRGTKRPACCTHASDTPDATLVVRSDYTLPDLTLDLLAAIVVESAAKGAKTEAA